MFKCQISGRISLPGEKPFRIVTKTRNKDYYEERFEERKSYKRDRDNKEEPQRGIKKLMLVGSGWEIVEEKVVCKEIFDNYNGKKY